MKGAWSDIAALSHLSLASISDVSSPLSCLALVAWVRFLQWTTAEIVLVTPVSEREALVLLHGSAVHGRKDVVDPLKRQTNQINVEADSEEEPFASAMGP